MGNDSGAFLPGLFPIIDEDKEDEAISRRDYFGDGMKKFNEILIYMVLIYIQT